MFERERQERVKALGNSIVPQIIELIGRKIMVWEKKKRNYVLGQISLRNKEDGYDQKRVSGQEGH